MNVLPLKGYPSLRAFNAFHLLLLGLKMLPIYASISYEKFVADFEERSEEEKENAIREAVLFVKLEREEVEALLSFTTDPNGIPLSAVNLKNLDPKDFHERIVAVCMAIGKIKIDLVTPAEKKSS